MTKTRWNRSREEILETRVKELESQLAQARGTTDEQVMRDMLQRAGIVFEEHREPNGTTIYLKTVEVRLDFWRDGRLADCVDNR